MFSQGENAPERLLDLKPRQTYFEACKSSPLITPVDLIAESARLDEALSRAESAARRELFHLLETGEVASSSAADDQQSIHYTCRKHFFPFPAGIALFAISLCFSLGIFILFPTRSDIVFGACRYFKWCQ
jgi:hypothetical protein